ncbi:MAG TPA: hypothetical protein VIM11_12245, partial [Tepidisphaeraceae bacterium]
MFIKSTYSRKSPCHAVRRAVALAEILEGRQLLAASIQPNYSGTLTLSKPLPAIVENGAPAATPKRLAFDLTISDQSASGALTGGFSADQLGTFAFQGSKHGSKVELIVAGENGGAGVLFVTLSRNGKALNGRWSSTIGSQQITGEVRALAGGTTVSAPDSPATIGQTASGPFVQTFNGTA